ncbi:60S ribosomal protein L27, putative [Cryptosporidium muris RN66]|uniref:60S ribosomal protein L27, putative n=1 Tax=Cryptosporidium muris (strain RN66) TaxID=441375 RepID=B6AI63_CRYMR|nr:60S ribosomal protein L27, putative [Cryptosporidium muris RN66]EEA07904.1 60S ribosomal protein L27, putative [Cryptosporidium muris RN66]|eukprot:XP_002142253.1 60S ribosomal protein L27 [Cryptosporidium muris RN66]
MAKLMRPGRVVVLLSGRYAGKKAVIVNTFESGTKERSFPFILVAGVERAPLKVHKRLSKSKLKKKTTIRPFLKSINMNHVMPTRYVVTEFDIKTLIQGFDMQEAEGKKQALRALHVLFNEKLINIQSDKGKAPKDLIFLRRPLRF